MSTPVLQRKFSWLASTVIVALTCVLIVMAAEPLADWISFDWLVVGAVLGGIVAGVLSARKREVTLLEYSVMSAAGLASLVLWYWWPLLCVGGFLLPFSAAGVITIYVEQTRKRAEPDAGPNDEERG